MKCAFRLVMGLVVPLVLSGYHLSAQEGIINGLNLSPPPLYPSITAVDFRNCFVNQASLAYLENHTVGIEYYSRFGMPELSVKSLFYTAPFDRGAFGFRYSGYGFTELMYHHFSVSGGISLSGNLALGVEASLSAAASPAQDAARLSASGQIGLIYRATEKTSLGIHLANPVPQKLRDYPSPSALRIGIGSTVSDRARVSAMLEKRSHHPLSAAAGLSYDITPATTLRAGFETGTGSLGFTAVFRFAGFSCSLAFLTHSRLGLSPVAAINKSF
jgi:hypothetical protein